jgi:hypothetical protein
LIIEIYQGAALTKTRKSFAEEYKVRKLIIVSNDPSPRQMADILVLPWKEFLQRLWEGDIIG